MRRTVAIWLWAAALVGDRMLRSRYPVESAVGMLCLFLIGGAVWAASYGRSRLWALVCLATWGGALLLVILGYARWGRAPARGPSDGSAES